MTTEQRAEELESRVGSVEHMNLLLQSQSTSMNASHGGTSTGEVGQSKVPPQPPPRSGRPNIPFEPTSPPLSGRSTPKGVQKHDGYLQKYHTVSVACQFFKSAELIRLLRHSG